MGRFEAKASHYQTAFIGFTRSIVETSIVPGGKEANSNYRLTESHSTMLLFVTLPNFAYYSQNLESQKRSQSIRFVDSK